MPWVGKPIETKCAFSPPAQSSLQSSQSSTCVLLTNCTILSPIGNRSGLGTRIPAFRKLESALSFYERPTLVWRRLFHKRENPSGLFQLAETGADGDVRPRTGGTPALAPCLQ